MNSQRSLIGIAAVLCTAAGISLLVLVRENTSSISGILIRLGMMLGATWLAMPSLVKPEHQKSLYAVAIFFGLVLLVAARPKIFVAVVLIGAVAMVINWALKRVAKQ